MTFNDMVAKQRSKNIAKRRGKSDPEIQQIYDNLASIRAKFVQEIHSPADIKSIDNDDMKDVVRKLSDVVWAMLDAMGMLEDRFGCE